MIHISHIMGYMKKGGAHCKRCKRCMCHRPMGLSLPCPAPPIEVPTVLTMPVTVTNDMDVSMQIGTVEYTKTGNTITMGKFTPTPNLENPNG